MSNKFWLWMNTLCLIIWTVDLINHLRGIALTSTTITCSLLLCISYFSGEILKYFVEERNDNGTENGPSGSTDL